MSAKSVLIHVNRKLSTKVMTCLRCNTCEQEFLAL